MPEILLLTRYLMYDIKYMRKTVCFYCIEITNS